MHSVCSIIYGVGFVERWDAHPLGGMINRNVRGASSDWCATIMHNGIFENINFSPHFKISTSNDYCTRIVGGARHLLVKSYRIGPNKRQSNHKIFREILIRSAITSEKVGATAT